jgi:hypothetical protein
MGWRTHEPVVIETEKPRALRQMAEMIYGDPIDFARMAHDTHMHSDALRELLNGYAEKRSDGPPSDGKIVTMRRRRA